MSDFETLELTADEKLYVETLKRTFNDVACSGMPKPLKLDVTKRRDLPPQIEDKWNPYDDRPYYNLEIAASDKSSSEVGWELMLDMTEYGGLRFNFEPHLTFNMRQYSDADLKRNGSALMAYTHCIVNKGKGFKL